MNEHIDRSIIDRCNTLTERVMELLAEREELRAAVRAHLASLSRCAVCGAPATARSLADLDHCDKHAGGLDRQMPGANRLRALLALLPPEAP